MIRCKEVATLLSTGELAAAPVARRLAVRMHLMMCRHCRRFARQIAWLKRSATALGAAFDAEIDREFTRRVQAKLRILSAWLVGAAAVFALGGAPSLRASRQAAAPVVDVERLGPKVGETVPDFNLPDQRGATRSLKTLMGPKGAILVFFRSADW
jgi:hypothetical protein